MSKSAEAFRTISEVADVLGTPAHVLRFWESRFTQIKPVKRAGGRRYYRPADVALLGGIKKLLHDDGLTIRGVQKILREHGIRHVSSFAGIEFEADEDSPPDASHEPRPATSALGVPHPLDRSQSTAATRVLAPSQVPLPDYLAPPGLVGERPMDLAGTAAGPAVDTASSPADASLLEVALLRDPTAADPGTARPPENKASAPSANAAAGEFDGGTAMLGHVATRLRALDANLAEQKRIELRAIYDRLSAAHARRKALGHRADT